jgi:hypothetical protein
VGNGVVERDEHAAAVAREETSQADRFAEESHVQTS